MALNNLSKGVTLSLCIPSRCLGAVLHTTSMAVHADLGHVLHCEICMEGPDEAACQMLGRIWAVHGGQICATNIRFSVAFMYIFVYFLHICADEEEVPVICYLCWQLQDFCTKQNTLT